MSRYSLLSRLLPVLALMLLALTLAPGKAAAHAPGHGNTPAAVETPVPVDPAGHRSLGQACCGIAVFCSVLALPERQDAGLRAAAPLPAGRLPADDPERASSPLERDPPIPRAAA
ncbi:MAG: hypothetical protein AB7G39_03345 [Alphaproteobacteria bacterium]